MYDQWSSDPNVPIKNRNTPHDDVQCYLGVQKLCVTQIEPRGICAIFVLGEESDLLAKSSSLLT